MKISGNTKRIIYPVAHPIRRLYWFVFRPHTTGVKVVVEKDKKILLVKLGYAHKLWTFPGGKVDRGESPENAAVREVAEETGVNIFNLTKIGEYSTRKEYKQDTVKCYKAYTDTHKLEPQEFEVDKAAWFSIDRLPSERAKQVDDILRLLKR